MRSSGRLLGGLVCGLVVWSGCASPSGGGRPDLSMKGYELYSWPADQEWAFVLLVGTNRLKTIDEIKFPDHVLLGVDAVKSALAALPAGEEVFWEGTDWIQSAGAPADSIALPPSAVRDEIAAWCAQLGVKLTVES